MNRFRTFNQTYPMKATVKDICDITMKELSREYEYHMFNLLIDSQNHLHMKSEDFVKWKGKVLLLLSADDRMFNDEVKNSLIALMPSPTIRTDMPGRQQDMLLKIKKYANVVTEFILTHSEQ